MVLSEGLLLRVWRWVVATFCQEGNWEVDAQLCLSRGPAHLCRPRPGKCPTGLGCLISNSWAAFVAWPNFCILCVYTETLNYLSSLPFNKFILECFDWRKLQMKLRLQIRKLHSEVQILGFWLNVGKVGRESRKCVLTKSFQGDFGNVFIFSEWLEKMDPSVFHLVSLFTYSLYVIPDSFWLCHFGLKRFLCFLNGVLHTLPLPLFFLNPIWDFKATKMLLKKIQLSYVLFHWLSKPIFRAKWLTCLEIKVFTGLKVFWEHQVCKMHVTKIPHPFFAGMYISPLLRTHQRQLPVCTPAPHF